MPKGFQGMVRLVGLERETGKAATGFLAVEHQTAGLLECEQHVG